MDSFRYRFTPLSEVLFFSVLLLTACATLPLPTRSLRTGDPGALGSCADFFAALDQRTEAAEVMDPGTFRVKNYPYLRVNRFIASFRREIDGQTAFAAWADRMQALDRDARKYEIANLPDAAVASHNRVGDRSKLIERVAACGDLLRAADFHAIEDQEELRGRLAAPDDYIDARRVLGVYPFTQLFVSHGVSKWHAEAQAGFSLGPPVDWRTIRYLPARKISAPSVRQIVTIAKRDALGIPQYAAEDCEALFHLYAPIWEIQIQSDDDRIGSPLWTANGVLAVDTDQPLTYTLLSFTRFGKQILTQLNYIIWFPARPKQSTWDLYGGLLDGLNYRVTLGNDGKPLIYETIHNCGCYYKAYPTQRLAVREIIDYTEPPLILKAPELNPAEEFMTVAMASRTHYVQHLYPLSRDLQPAAEVYSFADYGQLRSLAYSGQERRSMFSQTGIAPGSARLERFILWPTGVLSPGGMRQWGRHAVAFVGRRHFDDPFFMDKMFRSGFKTPSDARFSQNTFKYNR